MGGGATPPQGAFIGWGKSRICVSKRGNLIFGLNIHSLSVYLWVYYAAAPLKSIEVELQWTLMEGDMRHEKKTCSEIRS